MPNLQVVSIPARRSAYGIVAVVGAAILVALLIYHQRLSMPWTIGLSLFGGLFTFGGLKQIISPTPFAVLSPTGLAFPLSRIKEIPWDHIIDAQVGPKSITRGRNTTVFLQLPVVLRLTPEKNLSPLAQLAQQASSVERPDGTLDRLVDMSWSTVPADKLIALIRERSPTAAAPHLAAPTNAFSASKGMPAKNAILVALFGAVFVVAGIFFTVQSYRAHAWPQTNGTVIYARVVESHNREGESYRPDIEYRYTVGGHDYIGRQVAISFPTGRSAAQEIVDRHPAGHATMVYYNPNTPSAAVLEQSSAFSPLLFVGMGAIIAVAGLFLRRASRSTAGAP